MKAIIDAVVSRCGATLNSQIRRNLSFLKHLEKYQSLTDDDKEAVHDILADINDELSKESPSMETVSIYFNMINDVLNDYYFAGND